MTKLMIILMEKKKEEINSKEEKEKEGKKTLNIKTTNLLKNLREKDQEKFPV